MSLFSKIVIGSFIALFVGLFIVWCMMAVGPDGKSMIGTTKIVHARVANIYDAGGYDIAFKLVGYNNVFYINRGAERGLDADSLKILYAGKEMDISFVSHFQYMGGHINQVQSGDSLIYSELKNQ